ncbi:TetR/AcrR family transcriptional regulator [Nocardia arthritidis]|uniref:TetR family transcriptional regulator n=1 Tax=Nocardia arthritidis TaxID=228602 RepID=A0A6G9YAZ2_9NOCA|nr:TetR/AcrR family transcriptional regulator [Nocardia arthritidis]QIS10399.1 TetR family transcriptional regulator [Nocardia arthritidis]
MAETKAQRGRIDKRSAILEVAFDVFAERGYRQACVQEIANAAGVAKPTVYNHLNDKETLFQETVLAAADAMSAETVAAVDPLRDPGDVRAALTETALRLVRSCAGERGRALRRLANAQSAEFPNLIDEVMRRTTIRLREALSDRLARLVLAGALRQCDPTVAAEHLLALLTGPLEIRTHLGTRKPATAELRAIADAAVDTFLRAYT